MAEAALSRIRCTSPPRSTRSSAHEGTPHRALDVELDTGEADRRRPVRDRLEDRRRTRISGGCRSTIAPQRRPRHPALAHRVHRARALTLIGGAASSMRTGRFLATGADVDHRSTTSAAAILVRTASRSRIRSTATTRATRASSTSTFEPDALDGRRSLAGTLAQRVRAITTSGTFVMIASTPAAASARDVVGIVDRPDAHPQTGGVRGGDRRPAARRARTRRRGSATRDRARPRSPRPRATSCRA